MPTIAVDAMGGDHAPDVVIAGVAEVSLDSDIDCVLIGDETRIRRALEARAHRRDRVSIVHAPEVISMSEDPRQAVERKPRSSLVLGIQAVEEGGAKALVSAGNTGACVLACAKGFRRISGIRKTALATVFPRRVENPGQDPLALLLDVGATVRCETEDLVQFAIMGSAYAKRISKVSSPRVGLLNIGSEPYKGGSVLAETHRRLSDLDGLEFIGNVEGNDVTKGRADVIVCEGFVGNVVIKLLEGFSETVLDLADYAARESLLWRAGLALLGTGVRRVRDMTDYQNYGGSPILGFESLFIKAHGRSSSRAIANAIKVAAKAVRDGVTREIAEQVAESSRGARS